MSIKIGNIELENNVILAPMSGVTDLPFRRLVKRYGAALVVSEMIASHALIRQTRDSLRMAQSEPEEFPMSVQIAGCEEDIMAEAAKLNEDRGAQIIDINYGCPVKKVVNGHAGSAMMKDEDKAVSVLEAVIKAVNIPVTLKMRTGWDITNRNAPSLAKKAQDAGIQMLTIHGRTRNQMYKGKSDWEFIRSVKDAVDIPVIANGDITDYNAAQECLDKSGADGIMIGRGAYGRPWFINQAAHYLKTGEKLPDPTIEQQYNIVMEHYDMIIEHYGEEGGIRIARKHLGWYSSGYHGSADYRRVVMQESNASTVRQQITDYYNSLM